MNRHNTIKHQVRALDAVNNVFRDTDQDGRAKHGRPARSYRGARRNLARALRSAVRPKISFPQAWHAAGIATMKSLGPAPKVAQMTVKEKLAAVAAGTHVPAPPFAPGDDATVEICTGTIDIIPADAVASSPNLGIATIGVDVQADGVAVELACHTPKPSAAELIKADVLVIAEHVDAPVKTKRVRKPAKKIATGLKDAIAFAKGDETKAKVRKVAAKATAPKAAKPAAAPRKRVVSKPKAA